MKAPCVEIKDLNWKECHDHSLGPQFSSLRRLLCTLKHEFLLMPDLG